MGYLARADDFEKEAEKKLYRWSRLFGIQIIWPNYEAAAERYEKAATTFKLAKSWDRAGAAYVKLASCHFKLNMKFEAAIDYEDAAHCYKKSNIQESLIWLKRCVELLLEIGELETSAECYKEIAKLYEQQKYLKKAMFYYEKAADLFQAEDLSYDADECVQKIAQFSSQLEQYPKAIKIYEDLARRQSLKDGYLNRYFKYGYLLNAGVCQLCKGDVVAIKDAFKRYLKLDSTFAKTREYRLLANLAAAIDEEDVTKFTGAIKKYNKFLYPWNITLLLRVKKSLEAKELEEDLT